MRTSIDRNGMLKIVAQTELEMYALKMWLVDNYCQNTEEINTSNVSFVTDDEGKQAQVPVYK